jgi:REP element-mobilizing transposase RayT
MNFRRKNIRLHPTRYRGRTWFFITICCESRRPVFSNGRHAERLIASLKKVAEKSRFNVHAFCVMPDHFHALVEGFAPESDLLAFVRSFKQASSREYSKDYGTTLWQKKFYDHILRSKDSPEAISWYIWMNPVRKGLCSQPHEYNYSGSFCEEWKMKVQPKEQWVPNWQERRRIDLLLEMLSKSARALPAPRRAADKALRTFGPRLRSRCDVFGLIAFRALLDLEFNHLAFVQRLVAVHLDGGEVNEYVFAGLALDETIPL